MLGLPVATHDTDFWLHTADIEMLNAALEKHDHFANRTPEEARKRGRYVIENGEHIDVLVTPEHATVHGTTLRFDDVWSRRVAFKVGRATAQLPCIEDLIRTKEFALRAKDIADIQMLLALQKRAP